MKRSVAGVPGPVPGADRSAVGLRVADAQGAADGAADCGGGGRLHGAPQEGAGGAAAGLHDAGAGARDVRRAWATVRRAPWSGA